MTTDQDLEAGWEIELPGHRVLRPAAGGGVELEDELPGAANLRRLRELDAAARLPAAGGYDQPLDARRLAAEQPYQRALLCAQLDTMWSGLQQDIEEQRATSERGVDPRSQQLQLQIIKIKAQLWRMLAAPLPEPEPEPDPEQQLLDARTRAEEVLAAVQAKLGDGTVN